MILCMHKLANTLDDRGKSSPKKACPEDTATGSKYPCSIRNRVLKRGEGFCSNLGVYFWELMVLQVGRVGHTIDRCITKLRSDRESRP